MLKRSLLLAALCGVAYGGPPLITDDPDTTAKGTWEVNLAVTAEHRSDLWADAAPLLDMSYGLLDSVELDFTMPFVVDRGGGHHGRGGAGDPQAGFKWEFLEQEDIGVSVATGPSFTWNVSTSAARRGLVDPGWGFELPVEVMHRFGADDRVYGEAGYLWRERGGNDLTYGVAMEHDCSKSFTVMGELHAEKDHSFHGTELVAGAGFLWQFQPHVALLGSVDRGLTRGDEPLAKALGYLGLQFTF